MAASNNKRIEETATTALKAAFLRCPLLDSYVDSNDKTPSWDGTVFVYANETQKKADLIGRVLLQIKGTEKIIISNTASFSCKLSDLNNYYRDGGCLFFLISVDTASGASSIYYADLQVFDLKKILDSAGKQKSATIKLKRFPDNDANEMASIFMSFVDNSRKQMSFIGKDIAFLSQLKERGINIESISFKTSGIGLNTTNIGRFITTHDFYLYAKPKGLDIEIPFEKVSNPIVSRTITEKVQVNGKEYYASYTVIYEDGNESIRIGKGITIRLYPSEERVEVNVKAAGTLSDYIQDISCFLAMAEHRELVLNGNTLKFKNIDYSFVNNYKKRLQYYKDVKRMLEILGVTEELQCNNLSENDEANLRNFTNAVLYSKKIGFPGAKEDIMYGGFKIANLSIWIWATKVEDGLYKIESFFNPLPFAVFYPDDCSHSNPIPATQYLLLDKEAFIHSSNIDYEVVKKDIKAMKHHALVNEYALQLMLIILHAYDEQTTKEPKLLDLAEIICDWLALDETESNISILKLNHLQIQKRRRTLTIQEKIELGKLTGETEPVTIRCGAFILLDAIEEAQKCFDELTEEEQNSFIQYPICHFGKPIQKGAE